MLCFILFLFYFCVAWFCVWLLLFTRAPIHFVVCTASDRKANVAINLVLFSYSYALFCAVLFSFWLLLPLQEQNMNWRRFLNFVWTTSKRQANLAMNLVLFCVCYVMFCLVFVLCNCLVLTSASYTRTPIYRQNNWTQYTTYIVLKCFISFYFIFYMNNKIQHKLFFYKISNNKK